MSARLAPRIGNVVVGLIIWIACAAIAMLTLGAWPRTPTGWLLILALGPLVLIAGEALGQAAIEGAASMSLVRRVGRWVQLRAPISSTSVLRIGALLGAALVMIGVVITLGLLGNTVFGAQLAALDAFVHRHFH